MLHCKLARKPMSGEITGPGEEPVVIVLLNDHVIRLSSKYCACSHRLVLISALDREASCCRV